MAEAVTQGRPVAFVDSQIASIAVANLPDKPLPAAAIRAEMKNSAESSSDPFLRAGAAFAVYHGPDEEAENRRLLENPNAFAPYEG